jgi:Flp pilus assembly protein TadD
MFYGRGVLSALMGGVVLIAGAMPQSARAGDLKITIPRRTHYTPVQKLNRDGVEQVNKHNYGKAEQLFYKAYLLDPDDPFTLNNLGFISELQGQLERAQSFYALAASEPTDAVVDRASVRRVQGATLQAALNGADSSLQVSQANVQAVRLLSQGRAVEADSILQTALKTDPNNVFTLNNLGVAKEMQGEEQEALRYYDQSAAAHSNATAAVTMNRTLRGRPVGEISQEGAKAVRARLAQATSVNEQVAELNLRGVSAVNRNDLRSAEKSFREAYALDPASAFTMNNIAFVAELGGDRETAQFFYDRAREATDANATVAVASRHSAEGLKLSAVSADSNSRVEARMSREQQDIRRQHETPVLYRRDNSVVDDTPPESSSTAPSAQPR